MDASLQTRLARRSKNECSIFIADRANEVSHSVYSSLANPTIAVLAYDMKYFLFLAQGRGIVGLPVMSTDGHGTTA